VVDDDVLDVGADEKNLFVVLAVGVVVVEMYPRRDGRNK